MKIYNNQLKELSVSIRKSYIKSANVSLREKFPQQTVNFNDEMLNQRIDKAIIKAKKYKITGKENVTRFLEYIIFFGDDFDLNPPNAAIKKILLTVSFSGKDKIKRIDKFNLINN